uniref:Uncharacterized protein n=1 Tax=viral metagenome TaxID=1070528 RepID=A0A6M3L4V9_9ZZZZ
MTTTAIEAAAKALATIQSKRRYGTRDTLWLSSKDDYLNDATTVVEAWVDALTDEQIMDWAVGMYTHSVELGMSDEASCNKFRQALKDTLKGE